MEVGRAGRSSISGRLEATSFSPNSERVNLATSAKDNSCHGHHHEQPRRQLQSQPQQQHHFKNRSMKMFNKVQVVYYLTRNGQLEHPHFMEVSHLATQPLRLKDVLDRLTVLRGKTMPCQYSWSCKRSYKNGYVWNDLTENDVIYAAEGSEYVLKGSEIIHETDFSEIRSDEVQSKKRQQRKRNQMNTREMVTNKSGGTHQGRIYGQVATKNCEQEAAKNYDQTENHDDEEEEEEEEEDEKGSCDSSNAPYPTMQIEQEESYSLHSTSSNNSDKQPPPPPPTQGAKTSSASETKRSDKEAAGIVQEDEDPTVSTSLARNSTALLHLIACGGGFVSPQGKGKGKSKEKINNAGGSNRNFNFSMKNSFMPCLKQQLSTRGVSTSTNAIPLRLKGAIVSKRRQDDHQVVSKEDVDEDMMMVRYMSENPRFGNLQSEDKEYFSGTIVEAMSTHHQHTHSTGSAASHPHPHPPPVLTKSSSYNEQRSSRAGLQAAASKVDDEDDEKEDTKVKGIIKLCIPRKKSCSSTSTKHT